MLGALKSPERYKSARQERGGCMEVVHPVISKHIILIIQSTPFYSDTWIGALSSQTSQPLITPSLYRNVLLIISREYSAMICVWESEEDGRVSDGPWPYLLIFLDPVISCSSSGKLGTVSIRHLPAGANKTCSKILNGIYKVRTRGECGDNQGIVPPKLYCVLNILRGKYGFDGNKVKNNINWWDAHGYKPSSYSQSIGDNINSTLTEAEQGSHTQDWGGSFVQNKPPIR